MWCYGHILQGSELGAQDSKDRARKSSLRKTIHVPCKGGFPKIVFGLKAPSRMVLDFQGEDRRICESSATNHERTA